MPQDNSLVTNIAKQLVTTYTKHVDERIKDLDRMYVSLGVDATFKEYESLFKVVIAKVLGLPLSASQIHSSTKNQVYPQRVLTECINPLIDTVQGNGWEKYLDNTDNGVLVYQACAYVLEKVRVDKFPHEVLETMEETQTLGLLS